MWWPVRASGGGDIGSEMGSWGSLGEGDCQAEGTTNSEVLGQE